MPWATPDDVDAVVGLTVDAREIARAAMTLETITGLILSPGMTFDPVTLTFPNGSTLHLAREGDIVTFEASIALSPSNLPFAANYVPRATLMQIDDGMGIVAILLDVDNSFGFGEGFVTIGNSATPAALAGSYIATPATGVPDDPRPDISDRDRYYLKLMTCYQVAFMRDNPDIFSRADVTSASQDGESASFRNPDSHLLGPLARKAYRRLSWRAKTLLMPDGSTPTKAAIVDVNSEEFDDRLPWEPMG